MLLASSRRLRVLERARGLLRSDAQPDVRVLIPSLADRDAMVGQIGMRAV